MAAGRTTQPMGGPLHGAAFYSRGPTHNSRDPRQKTALWKQHPGLEGRSGSARVSLSDTLRGERSQHARTTDSVAAEVGMPSK